MIHLSGMWKKDRVRWVLAICLFVFSLQFAGCAYLMPKTAALDKIHETYRADFQKYVLLSVPEPSRNPTTERNNSPLFDETLRAIRSYRVQYGEESQEAAHLKVLEGMIYLQSGQYGMARLLKDDVGKAQGKLISKTGSYTRDQLLAITFPSLIDGWEQTTTEGVDVKILEDAADKLKTELGRLDQKKLADPEVDEGAVYIATTTAIFYVWVYSRKALGCEHKTDCLTKTKKEYFGKGRDLIGSYLSETEKKAALEAGKTGDLPPGRLRYIQWYGYLLQQSNATGKIE